MNKRQEKPGARTLEDVPHGARAFRTDGSYAYVQVRIVKPEGGDTTCSFPVNLWTTICARVGGPKRASLLVRQLNEKLAWDNVDTRSKTIRTALIAVLNSHERTL